MLTLSKKLDQPGFRNVPFVKIVALISIRFLGVPRVWEKIEEKMREIGKQNSGVKKLVADWAKQAAYEHHTDLIAGKPGNSLRYRIARKLILSRIHAALGLDRAAHPEFGGKQNTEVCENTMNSFPKVSTRVRLPCLLRLSNISNHLTCL